jgi:hypothetical protein
MAIASVGTIGTGTNAGSASSANMTTATNNVSIGNLAVLLVTKDNTGTTSGNTNEITSVSDSAGNTWTKGYEYCFTAGAAGDGQTVAIFYTRATSALNTGGTITANFSAASTDILLSGWTYTIGAAPAVFGSSTGTGTTSTNPGSLTIGSLASAQYLAVRAFGSVVDTSITSNTASYTNMTNAIMPAGPTGTIAGEFIISTATSFTSAPTVGSSSRNASAMIILGESAAPAANRNTIFFHGTF